jgi:hypothetical protein
MPNYQTSFEINAPANRVWQVLTTLDRYGEWNPQISRASGTLRQGARIHLRLTLPGRPAMDLSATIEEAQSDRVLTWRGHVMAPWLFEGYRRFAIEPIAEDRVRLTHLTAIPGAQADKPPGDRHRRRRKRCEAHLSQAIP